MIALTAVLLLKRAHINGVPLFLLNPINRSCAIIRAAILAMIPFTHPQKAFQKWA